jgi:signal transduction histidine kinase
MRRTTRALAAAGLQYAALAAYIGGVYGIAYAAGSLAFGRPSPVVALVATGTVGASFRAVRGRVRRVVNRFVYGHHVAPEQALATLGARAAHTDAIEDVLPRMARVVAGATGAASAEVWLVVQAGLVRAASTAGDEPVTIPFAGEEDPVVAGADRSIPIRHQGELLGVLAIAEAHNRPVLPSEEKLLADLASQAGVVLRNVRLTAELERRLDDISEHAGALRASRQRIVEAQDAERRRLERDIHDGAQQHLTALAVKMRLARKLAEHSPSRATELLHELRDMTEGALVTLRELAHGIYPDVLTAHGVARALDAHARVPGRTMRVEDGGIGRYIADVEAAAYFSCLEAMQNAVKHADASRIDVRLDERDGELRFVVRDDGTGFDPVAVGRGAGLQNIADRVSALGGGVEVESSPDTGTTVTGRIPVRLQEWAPA